jgi:hypothetical protein
MSIDEMIAALQSAKAQKTIQFRIADSVDEWRDATDPHWNFEEFDYRAKPMPIELYVNLYPNGNIGGPWLSREGARQGAEIANGPVKTIKLREVLE